MVVCAVVERMRRGPAWADPHANQHNHGAARRWDHLVPPPTAPWGSLPQHTSDASSQGGDSSMDLKKASVSRRRGASWGQGGGRGRPRTPHRHRWAMRMNIPWTRLLFVLPIGLWVKAWTPGRWQRLGAIDVKQACMLMLWGVVSSTPLWPLTQSSICLRAHAPSLPRTASPIGWQRTAGAQPRRPAARRFSSSRQSSAQWRLCGRGSATARH